MDGTKTRIYGGGLAELMRKSGTEPVSEKALQPGATTLVGGHGLNVHGEAAEPDSQGRTSSPLQQRLDVRGRHPTFNLSSTRIMPIERLLPGYQPGIPTAVELAAAALTTGALPAGVAAEPEPRTKRASGVPRALSFSVLTVLTVAAVAVWKLPLEGEPTVRLRKPVATHAQTPAAALPIAPTAAITAEPAPAAPAAPQPEPPIPNRVGAERAAIDAIIAGDYATAQRLYSQLARGNPQAPAFAEAARIVAAYEHSQP